MNIQLVEKTIIILAAVATIISATIVCTQALGPPAPVQAILTPCTQNP